MNASYVECLVTKGISMGGKAARVICMALTIFFGIFGLMGYLIALGLAAVFGVITWLVYKNTYIEYEYLYLDREIKVDKIVNMSRRKQVATYEVDRMEIFAPMTSYHLDSYKNRQARCVDFSSGANQTPDKKYVFYYEGNQKVILEPDEKFIQALKNVAPRKVF